MLKLWVIEPLWGNCGEIVISYDIIIMILLFPFLELKGKIG